MSSRKIAAAFALITLCTSLPLAAGARNNANEQLIMANFNTAENNISNQINAYVASGQLSPQAAASFNSELSQITSNAMLDPGNSFQVQQSLNQFNSLTQQIQSSLAPAGTYAYNGMVNGAAVPVPAYGNTGFYNNWRNKLGFGHGYNPAYNNQSAAQWEREQNALNVRRNAEAINAAKQIDRQVKNDQKIDYIKTQQMINQRNAQINKNAALERRDDMIRANDIKRAQAARGINPAIRPVPPTPPPGGAPPRPGHDHDHDHDHDHH